MDVAQNTRFDYPHFLAQFDKLRKLVRNDDKFKLAQKARKATADAVEATVPLVQIASDDIVETKCEWQAEDDELINENIDPLLETSRFSIVFNKSSN